MSAGTCGSAVGLGNSGRPDVKVYKEGTLVVDMFDTGSRKIVWRGIAKGRRKNHLSQKEKDQVASVLSRELLAEFPPD